ncbi:MAG: competence/damage-inducible protein A [Clostridiales bacterium]|jgi:nicotinamide-nucleotide amidase|nr:competence/damage-inducible protein A [Clostridiales bacterium]
MNAEILAVGTELLLGDILNTNAQFLSQELAKLGINTYWQTVVGDNMDRLQEAYRLAFSRADLVIATGGLGPTEDDITKEGAALHFKRELVLDEKSWEQIQAYFQKLHAGMVPSNKKQAMIIEGGVPLENLNGTAPGLFFEENGKMLFLLPGPPAEAQPMFLDSIVPRLKALSSNTFVSKTIKICGVGESAVEELLRPMIDSQSNPTIATYAKSSEVWVRFTASAPNEKEALDIIRPTYEEAERILGINAYGTDGDTLASVVVRLLAEKNLKIAVAESCTGGMIASRIVDCPGASDVLLEGIVSYSNEAKVKRLGVKEETLREFGAVSPQTAEEMAKGTALASGADISISTTGVAGPGGGTPEKPVGLVYLGLFFKGETRTRKLNLAGNRSKVRERSAIYALDMARRALLEG